MDAGSLATGAGGEAGTNGCWVMGFSTPVAMPSAMSCGISLASMRRCCTGGLANGPAKLSVAGSMLAAYGVTGTMRFKTGSHTF